MKRELRTFETKFETREEKDSEKTIEGYFAVFNSNYDMGYGMSESIAPGAFTDTISDDVRALINHDDTLVLGRTSAGTLELKEDSHGLWGKIRINPNDTDAVNLYERVKRGDVTQCSFGFNITDEETEIRENGDIHWIIKSVKLYEVSPCTFPAYEQTGIQARADQKAKLEERQNEAWRAKMKNKLKGNKSNA